MLLVLEVVKSKREFDVGGGSSDVAFLFYFVVDVLGG
jgi:hypothetical protein